MPGIPAGRSVPRGLYDLPTTPSRVQEVSQPQKEEPGGRGPDRDVFTMLTEASLTHTSPGEGGTGATEPQRGGTNLQRRLEKTGEGV